MATLTDKEVLQAAQCRECALYETSGLPCPHFCIGPADVGCVNFFPKPAVQQKQVSDGSSADYYELPAGASQLQDLISHRNMNAQLGEIFRACYRYGMASHSDQLRDAKKIKFYIEAEIARLQKLGGG